MRDYKSQPVVARSPHSGSPVHYHLGETAGHCREIACQETPSWETAVRTKNHDKINILTAGGRPEYERVRKALPVDGDLIAARGKHKTLRAAIAEAEVEIAKPPRAATLDEYKRAYLAFIDKPQASTDSMLQARDALVELYGRLPEAQLGEALDWICNRGRLVADTRRTMGEVTLGELARVPNAWVALFNLALAGFEASVSYPWHWGAAAIQLGLCAMNVAFTRIRLLKKK